MSHEPINQPRDCFYESENMAALIVVIGLRVELGLGLCCEVNSGISSLYMEIKRRKYNKFAV